ncbi:hypothetical protein C4565_09885 [Candidatus Parcubacteria bacterium]|nr:MAG: hypothetical protein C4565_09885 [Candidatus Parcubacteria bacterium]
MKSGTKTKKRTTTTAEIPISVCDVMKDNTSKIIKKLESQIPFSTQHYFDLYAAFLHSIDDVFGTCYIAEKQFFDKIGFDQNTLKSFKYLSDQFADALLTQIEMTGNLQKSHLQFQKSILDMYEQYTHSFVDSYWKSLTELNRFLENTKKTYKLEPQN